MIAFLLVAAAGGLGAVCRFTLDGLVRGWTAARYPVGTTVINLTGSLLLGLVTGLALEHTLPESWRAILGTGFLGGYTTFSTASFETVRLLQEHRGLAAVANGLGMLLLSVGLAVVGLAVGLAVGSRA